MSRILKTVTRVVFEPGSYSSHSYRRNELCVDVHLPAPDGPFNVLRFKILDQTIVTVYFSGPAEIGAEIDDEEETT